MRLYTTPLSANGRKPLAVAHHLGLELEVEQVNVYAGEGRSERYLAINPWGKIPTLVDGDLALWESNAIVLYFADHEASSLSPAGPRARAEISKWLFWEAGHWQPAFNPVLAERVGQILFDSGDAPAEVAWATLAPELGHVDKHLGGRRWLVADALSVADFSIAGMMTYARRTAFPFDQYPNLARWYERIEALPAWRASEASLWREP